MNNVKAVCGHYVTAVGAPGSGARSKCENEPCPKCSVMIHRLAAAYAKALIDYPNVTIYDNIAHAYIGVMRESVTDNLVQHADEIIKYAREKNLVDTHGVNAFLEAARQLGHLELKNESI